MIASIGILSYNEAKNLPKILDVLIADKLNHPNIDFKICIINNGSTDDTKQVIENYLIKYNFVETLHIPVNKGYGYGIKQGLSHLNGDIIGFMWGDNQFDAKIIYKMIDEFIKDDNVKIVKTYRVKRYDGSYRLVISTIYQILFNLLYKSYIVDINSGPKLFKRNFFEELLPLKSDDWFIDAELMIKSLKIIEKKSIVQLPIDFFPRKEGKSNVKFSACFQFLYNLFKFKFTTQ